MLMYVAEKPIPMEYNKQAVHNKETKMEKTWKPVTAGILSILSGVVALLVGIGDLVKGELARRIVFHIGGEAIGVLLLALGIVAIIGGIFAIRRHVWGMALAGAICALFPLHMAILGILAIIFVALSKGEFDQSSPKTTDGIASSAGTKVGSTAPETKTPDGKSSSL